MNREDVLQLLLEYLQRFQFLYYGGFAAELQGLIAKSGYEQKFFKLFLVRLAQLAAEGAEAIQLEEFERLDAELCSMHMAGKGFNIRVIYSFLPGGRVVLLVPFYERGGKRKTDYTPYKKIARARLLEMKGALK